MPTYAQSEPPLSVLLVEDDPRSARRLAGLLDESELETEHRRAAGLEEALAAARERPPDVVVADLDLPDGRGLDTVRRLADSLPDVPLVVTAGPDELDVAAGALEAGADEYLREDGLTPALVARTLRMALERHRLSEAAARERGLSRSILDSLSEHIAVLDADGVILAVNDAWQAFAESEGGDPRGYTGESYLEVTRRAAERGVEEARRMLEGIRAVRDGERERFEMDYPCHAPDRERWFRVAAVPLRGRDEGGLVVSHIDVTDRVVERQQAREMEEKWATAFELAPIGIVISEPETGRIHAVNEAFEEMFGASADEMVGRTSLELGQWEDRERRGEVIDRLRERGVVEGEEAGYRTAEGERRQMRVSCRRLELAGENRLLWTVEDVTERRRWERRLEETTERLHGLLDAAAGIIFRIRLPDMAMVDVTRNVAEVAGFPAERWVDEPGFWRDRIPDEDLGRVLRTIEDAVGTGAGQAEEEFRIRHADDRLHWYRAVVRFEHDEEGTPAAFVGTAVDITGRRELEEQLRQQALHDPLTGLANRNLLDDRLRQALARSRRSGEPMGLLMVDVASFKRINDNLGHTAGDEVLREVGRRLEHVVRDSDTVARWGGDEFLLVFPDLEHPDALESVHARVREELAEPIETHGEGLEIDVTAGGVVRAGQADGETVETADPEELVRFVDLALHRAKSRAPGGFHRFTPGDATDGVPDLRVEQDLRRGLESDEIEVFYQPIRRIGDGSLWGVEALARWRHPERGLVGPAEFVPLAERIGLIHRLGGAVFRAGCEQAAAWTRDAPAAGDLRIAFNLSAHQLLEPGLAEQTERVLEATGLPADRVVAEVTETTVMRARGELEALRRLGVHIFIDDFGTGYSTYTYLRELELQGLKVDMAFVQGLGRDTSDAAIVESIVTLADRIGILAVAEGIETEAQLERLRALGCPLGQGFHLGRPVPASELTSVLEG